MPQVNELSWMFNLIIFLSFLIFIMFNFNFTKSHLFNKTELKLGVLNFSFLV